MPSNHVNSNVYSVVQPIQAPKTGHHHGIAPKKKRFSEQGPLLFGFRAFPGQSRSSSRGGTSLRPKPWETPQRREAQDGPDLNIRWTRVHWMGFALDVHRSISETHHKPSDSDFLMLQIANFYPSFLHFFRRGSFDLRVTRLDSPNASSR